MLVDQQGKACPVILFPGIRLKLFEIIGMALLIVDHSVSVETIYNSNLQFMIYNVASS